MTMEGIRLCEEDSVANQRQAKAYRTLEIALLPPMFTTETLKTQDWAEQGNSRDDTCNIG